MCRRLSRHPGALFFVDADTHPQTVAVLRTRAEPIGIDLVVGALADLDPAAAFGVLVSQPRLVGAPARPGHPRGLTTAVHDAGGLVVAASDLLSLLLLTARRVGR
jgi:glycine dehydrogenase